MRASEFRWTALILALASAPALAQERSSDNAVTQAEDAFGYSVGRETIGIYSSGNTRGFSPVQAGNVRIDGLYFDDLFDLSSPLTANVSIKVGLAAQGYPFAAPSGIVDIALRRPASAPGASIVLNSDSFGTVGLEVDGSLPVTAKLQLGYGLTGGAVSYYDGTSNINHGEALIARWRPAKGIEITPFWSVSNDYDDESGVYYVPQGRQLPPHPPYRRFEGERWAVYRYTGGDHGLLATITPAPGWTIRGGVFRSVFDEKSVFFNLLTGVTPDGRGERIVEADPRRIGRSISGEIRIAHSLAEGPRLHLFQLSARGRSATRQFGGSAQADLGPGRVGVPLDVAKPDFAFGPLSDDHVDQSTLGLTYEGRWKGVGEIGFSIGRSDYRDRLRLADVPAAVTTARPWVGDATSAITLGSRLVAYVGYARGLEQSGVAPPTATNRNQPLPAIVTSQLDGGLRWAPAGDLKVIAGVFDLRRPYFGFDSGGAYSQIGTTRSRGAELSVNGHVTPRLTVVAGGYLLDPRVEAGMGAATVLGRRPVGLPSHYASLNLNWQAPFKAGLAFDLRLLRRGHVPSTADNAAYLPARVQLDPGARYAFKLGGHSATARIQVVNLFDTRYFGLAGAGVYVAQARRYAQGYLAVDI